MRHAIFCVCPPAKNPHGRGDRNDGEGNEHYSFLLAQTKHGAVIQHQAQVQQIPRQNLHARVKWKSIRRIARDVVVGKFNRLIGDATKGPTFCCEIKRKAKRKDNEQRDPRGFGSTSRSE